MSVNITNRIAKPANREAILPIDCWNLQIEWPILQIEVGILQIEQTNTADAAGFKENQLLKR
ncbi:hypothetical protein LG298_24310 [Cytobacillus firmus]|uniref:hypothetical protein n=1 Tax=Cytobacillus firmus TaxID=1399 RepID=UPI00384B31B5